MVRWGLVVIVLACSCQPAANSPSPTNYTGKSHESGFVMRSEGVAPGLIQSNEGAVIGAAAEEFFSGRWTDWKVGEFIGINPNWVDGQFASFDQALSFWVVKFGNDGNSDEKTLREIRATLDAVSAPPATTGKVQKGLTNMELDERIVLIHSTYFGTTESWVPGAVPIKNSKGRNGTFRARCAMAYPLFSGGGRYAFVQMNQVKSGHESGQLHFFIEDRGGNWRVLAVGEVAE